MPPKMTAHATKNEIQKGSEVLRRVYFFIAEHEMYNDAAIHLAEGLHEIGVPFSANRNFWQIEPDQSAYLFTTDPRIRPEDCAVVVLTTLWFHYMEPETFEIKGLDMPDGLVGSGRRNKLVLLDAEDGYKTTSFEPLFRKFDIVFRTKMNRHTFNFPNMSPWILGFGQRIIKATSNTPSFARRKRCIVQNFGFTHKFTHGVRRVAADRFLNRVESHFALDCKHSLPNVAPNLPWDLLMWNQTVGKHNPDYYKQLCEAQCVACFCGDFAPGLPRDPSVLLVGGNKARLLRLFYFILSRVLHISDRIIQWDSWRFWETLMSGSVAIHANLEKYGVDIPVMPVNWKHYIGLDFDNIDRDINRFLALDQEQLSRIGTCGREWALDNYSPSASAIRFLATIKSEIPIRNHA